MGNILSTAACAYCFRFDYRVRKSSKKVVTTKPETEKESGGGERMKASTSTLPRVEDNHHQQPQQQLQQPQSQQHDLLTGRLNLEVVLPEKSTSFLLDVSRQTALIDILVNIANEAKLKSSELIIEPMPMPNGWQYKPTLPIGLLGTDRVKVLRKPTKAKQATSGGVASSVSTSSGGATSVAGELPFVPTIRLVINLPQRQKMVLRVDPTAPFKEIKPEIFDQRSLEPSQHIIVLPFVRGAALEILNDDRSLNDYGGVREVTLVTLREYQELSKLVTATDDGDGGGGELQQQQQQQQKNRARNSLAGQNVDLSQSVPNLSRIVSTKRATLPPLPANRHCDNQSVSSRGSRSFKKKPAPPPPIAASMASISRLDPIEDISEPSVDDQNKEIEQPKDAVVVPAASTTTTIVAKQPKIVLSRQSSGSDSSGYHEMLSSGGMSTNPSSPAPPPLAHSPHPASNGKDGATLVNSERAISQSLSKIDEIVGGTRLLKKRKAPLPPPPSSSSATTSPPTSEPINELPVESENHDEQLQSVAITSSASVSPEPMSPPTSPEPTSMSTSSEPTTSCSMVSSTDVAEVVTDSLPSSPIPTVEELSSPLHAESVHPPPQQQPDEADKSRKDTTPPPQEKEAEIPVEVPLIQNNQVTSTNFEGDNQTKESEAVVVEQHSEVQVDDEQQQQQEPDVSVSVSSSSSAPCDDQQTGEVSPSSPMPMERKQGAPPPVQPAPRLSKASQQQQQHSTSSTTTKNDVVVGCSHNRQQMCADCLYYTTNFNRIRTQFARSIEANDTDSTVQQRNTSAAATTTATTTNAFVSHSEENDNKVVVNEGDTPQQQQPKKEDEDESQVVEQQEAEDETLMMAQPRQNKVVTVSQWKSVKETDLLFPKSREDYRVNTTNTTTTTSSSSSGAPCKENNHKHADGNLERQQVEVMLAQLDEALGEQEEELQVDDELEETSMGSDCNTSSALSNFVESRVDGDNDKYRSNLVKSASNSSSGSLITAVSKTTAPRAESAAAENKIERPASPRSSTISVHDQIRKLNNIRDNPPAMSNKMSASSFDISEVKGSTDSNNGTLRRSSSRTIDTSVVPTPRKLANFRIESFKKEIDIYGEKTTARPGGAEKNTAAAVATMPRIRKSPDGSIGQQQAGIPSFVPTNNVNNKSLSPVAKAVATTTTAAKNFRAFKANLDNKSEDNHSSNTTAPPATPSFLDELKSRTWGYKAAQAELAKQLNFDAMKRPAAAATNNNNNTTTRVSPPAEPTVNTKNVASKVESQAPSSQPVAGKGIPPPPPPPPANFVSSPTGGIPPPPPPPPPQDHFASIQAATSKSTGNKFNHSNILAPKGWKPVSVDGGGAADKSQNHPTTKVANTFPRSTTNSLAKFQEKEASGNARDALFNEIKNFRSTNLRKVTSNQPFSLKVHGKG